MYMYDVYRFYNILPDILPDETTSGETGSVRQTSDDMS